MTLSSQVSPKMSENIQFAAAVTEVAMLLNHSECKGTSTYKDAIQILKSLKSVDVDPNRSEFLDIVKKLSKLKAEEDKNVYVTSGALTVTGPINEHLIKKVVENHTDELRECYFKSDLSQSNDFDGHIVATWNISPAGKTENVALSNQTYNNDGLDACITHTIQSWEYPEPQRDGTITVKYPFDIIDKRFQSY